MLQPTRGVSPEITAELRAVDARRANPGQPLGVAATSALYAIATRATLARYDAGEL